MGLSPLAAIGPRPGEANGGAQFSGLRILAVSDLDRAPEGGLGTVPVRLRHGQPQFAIDAQQLRLAVTGVRPPEAIQGLVQ